MADDLERALTQALIFAINTGTAEEFGRMLAVGFTEKALEINERDRLERAAVAIAAGITASETEECRFGNHKDAARFAVDRAEALIDEVDRRAKERERAQAPRDPDAPCVEFRPGVPRGECAGDGHYRCSECEASRGKP